MQIREHAEANPEKPAIILHPSGTVVTFGELEARANRLAHHFRRHGLEEGDVVAILMENNEHIHTVMWAARRSGLYYVPINTHLTAAEAAYIIDNSGAKAIVGSAVLKDILSGLDKELPDGLPEVLLIADGELDGWQRYPEAVADLPATPIDDELDGDLLQYSSGTTGRPKGIKRELPHVPPSETPGMMSALVGFWMQPDSVYLSPAPLYHTAPSVWSMQTHAAGITTVVLEKFDAEGALDAIQKYGVTQGQFVPVMFTRMLKLPEDVRNSYDMSSLRRVMHAAAPCPVEIEEADDRLVGPDRRRVLRLLRGHRGDGDLRRGLVDPPGFGRQADERSRPHPRRGRQRSPTRSGRARSSSRAAPISSTSTTPRRRHPRGTRTVGRRWGTSGMSTRTATCTSPTGATT